jgi:hypothetical protein
MLGEAVGFSGDIVGTTGEAVGLSGDTVGDSDVMTLGISLMGSIGWWVVADGESDISMDGIDVTGDALGA